VCYTGALHHDAHGSYSQQQTDTHAHFRRAWSAACASCAAKGKHAFAVRQLRAFCAQQMLFLLWGRVVQQTHISGVMTWKHQAGKQRRFAVAHSPESMWREARFLESFVARGSFS